MTRVEQLEKALRQALEQSDCSITCGMPPHDILVADAETRKRWRREFGTDPKTGERRCDCWKSELRAVLDDESLVL